MPLSPAQATTEAENVDFLRRVRGALPKVAVLVHGGHTTPPYDQAQYDARALLARRVCDQPTTYAIRFAAVITANEFKPTEPPNQTWSTPGTGAESHTDPLVDDDDGNASLRAAIGYAWDTVAGTPEEVTPVAP